MMWPYRGEHSMVYIAICQKCGEAFEADTASRETICPRCLLDQDIENSLVEHLCPELWANNNIEMENGQWR